MDPRNLGGEIEPLLHEIAREDRKDEISARTMLLVAAGFTGHFTSLPRNRKGGAIKAARMLDELVEKLKGTINHIRSMPNEAWETINSELKRPEWKGKQRMPSDLTLFDSDVEGLALAALRARKALKVSGEADTGAGRRSEAGAGIVATWGLETWERLTGRSANRSAKEGGFVSFLDVLFRKIGIGASANHQARLALARRVVKNPPKKQ